jgi:hypothetical protein
MLVYFMVPELKGHSLENVDLLMRQCVPRKSANWKPIPETEVGMMDPKKYDIEMAEGKPTVSHIH